MKVYKVNRPDSRNFCVFSSWARVVDEFDGAEVGYRILVTLLEMTAEEFDNLPEFEGW